jgi:hypothetical protein
VSDPTAQNLRDRFTFLGDLHSREPYIYELLAEISIQQKVFQNNESPLLATIESLQESRNLRIPISPTRNKNIIYLIELLIKHYPDRVRSLTTFQFNADPVKKNLEVIERREFTVLLQPEKHRALQEQRDKESVENFLNLLASFRLFNLTRLLHKAVSRQYLSKLIKTELGRTVFTYKFHSFDKNGIERIEDLCFHKSNYEPVKRMISLDLLKKTVSENSAAIAKYLQRFGLLNADFSDYRDSKIDYIINIIFENMSSDIPQKDLFELRNFKYLRDCIIKVDRIIDPAVTVSGDILKFLKENLYSLTDDMIAMFPVLDKESLAKWAAENISSNKIITVTEAGTEYLIYGADYIKRISDSANLILINQESFDKKPHIEKQKITTEFEFLTNAGEIIAHRRALYTEVFNEADFARIEQILKDYSDYKKRIALRDNLSRESSLSTGGQSVIARVISFIKGFFGSKPDKNRSDSAAADERSSGKKISRETMSLFRRIEAKSGKIIPLSDFIELGPDKDYIVDSIIDELRNFNLKIVIPIYNSRKNLFPKRSQNYIMADVEYLMVDPEVGASAESIRAFTDSLTGYKMKDEQIPGTAIVTIEKYLLTLFRQKRVRREN